jgi:hypothetical protein
MKVKYVCTNLKYERPIDNSFEINFLDEGCEATLQAIKDDDNDLLDNDKEIKSELVIFITKKEEFNYFEIGKTYQLEITKCQDN